MGVRAILFDADGVIQGPAPNFHDQLREVFGLAQDQTDAFLHSVVSPAERRALTGERDFAKELAVELAHRNKAAPNPEALHVFTAIEVFSDIVDLIGLLRASGTPCYLASNQVPFRARYMSEFLGYRTVFDREFYSCDLAFAKPDTQFFRAVLEKISYAPGEALFIDDREENVAAAAEVGLLAALFVAKSSARPRECMLELLSRHGLQLS